LKREKDFANGPDGQWIKPATNNDGQNQQQNAV
jgi:hypothetical protein